MDRNVFKLPDFCHDIHPTGIDLSGIFIEARSRNFHGYDRCGGPDFVEFVSHGNAPTVGTMNTNAALSMVSTYHFLQNLKNHQDLQRIYWIVDDSSFIGSIISDVPAIFIPWNNLPGWYSSAHLETALTKIAKLAINGNTSNNVPVFSRVVLKCLPE